MTFNILAQSLGAQVVAEGTARAQATGLCKIRQSSCAHVRTRMLAAAVACAVVCSLPRWQFSQGHAHASKGMTIGLARARTGPDACGTRRSRQSIAEFYYLFLGLRPQAAAGQHPAQGELSPLTSS